MLSLSDNNQADIVEAFYSTSRYLDDLPNIDSNPVLLNRLVTDGKTKLCCLAFFSAISQYYSQ